MTAYIHKTLFLLSIILVCGSAIVAEAAPKGGNSSGASKSLENSKSVKYKSKTEVNFDDATIEGSVRTPFGQALNSRDQNFNRNFIKYRKHFHDQMLLSTGGLSP
ncbi:hypothetical protein EBU99_00845 [bacterium]|nr:hypothetical protein [bacterium]